MRPSDFPSTDGLPPGTIVRFTRRRPLWALGRFVLMAAWGLLAVGGWGAFWWAIAVSGCQP